MILSLTTFSQDIDVDLRTRIMYLKTLLYTFKCILNIYIKIQIITFIHVCMKYLDIMTYDSTVCDIDSSLEQLFQTQISLNLTCIKINMAIILWTHHYYLYIGNVYTLFNICKYTLILIGTNYMLFFSNLVFIIISYVLCHMAKEGFRVCVSNHVLLLKVKYG